MTRTRFHQGLEELKHKLLAMGGMAEKAVDTAVEAYRRRDLKLCHQVFKAPCNQTTATQTSNSRIVMSEMRIMSVIYRS